MKKTYIIGLALLIVAMAVTSALTLTKTYNVDVEVDEDKYTFLTTEENLTEQYLVEKGINLAIDHEFSDRLDSVYFELEDEFYKLVSSKNIDKYSQALASLKQINAGNITKVELK